MVQQGNLVPMSGPRGHTVPSHVLYADDLLIFCKGTKKNMECLMTIFNRYAEASGQCISKEKSEVYNGSIPSNKFLNIVDILGFGVGHLPFIYLGVPLFKGKPRSIHLHPLADKIKSKLTTSKGSLLSIMGRVQLV